MGEPTTAMTGDRADVAPAASAARLRRRGRGRATLARGAGGPLLRDLIVRYLGTADGPLARWLLGRAAEEVAVRIDPGSMTSRDYRERMAP